MKPIKEFAIQKGFTEKTIRIWIARHGLPIIRIGRRLYVDDQDFDTWLITHRQVTTQAPQQVLIAPVSMPASVRRRAAGSGIASKIAKIY